MIVWHVREHSFLRVRANDTELTFSQQFKGMFVSACIADYHSKFNFLLRSIGLETFHFVLAEGELI